MTSSFLGNTNKRKIDSIIQQMRSCDTTQIKIDDLIFQLKEQTTIVEPIEKNKIDDLIRQFKQEDVIVTEPSIYENIAATITTYDDVQYDDKGYYVKANEISKINLIPDKDKFIIKKVG